MFFRQIRILRLVSRCISNEAYDRGYRDRRLGHCLMNPPHRWNVPFSQRAHVYRHRTVNGAALQLLLQYSGEWRALVEYPGKGVSSSNASAYASIAEKAALNLANKFCFEDEDIPAQIEKRIVGIYHDLLPDLQREHSCDGLGRLGPPGISGTHPA